MRVKWHTGAKEALQQTANHIRKEHGSKSSAAFLHQALQTVKLLAKNPQIGSFEALLVEESVPYRSLVINRLNKLVYWVNDDCIEIVAFWDTRREPKAQAEQVNKK